MSITKRILVCGSRNYTDREKIWKVLDGYSAHYKVHLIEGGARGADTFAAEWATARYLTRHERYPANWNRFGRRAGFIRNRQMLEQGKPELVLAFGRGSGTDMMVRLAKHAGVEVKEYDRE